MCCITKCLLYLAHVLNCIFCLELSMCCFAKHVLYLTLVFNLVCCVQSSTLLLLHACFPPLLSGTSAVWYVCYLAPLLFVTSVIWRRWRRTPLQWGSYCSVHVLLSCFCYFWCLYLFLSQIQILKLDCFECCFGLWIQLFVNHLGLPGLDFFCQYFVFLSLLDKLFVYQKKKLLQSMLANWQATGK